MSVKKFFENIIEDFDKLEEKIMNVLIKFLIKRQKNLFFVLLLL